MSREVFPYADDRAFIDAWLLGKLLAGPSDWLEANTKSLLLMGNTIAWFGTDGALYGKVPSSQCLCPAIRALDYIARTLGMETAEITVEECVAEDTGKHGSRLFHAGTEINHEQPFVMCGPLGMQAYRATTGVSDG